MIELIVLFLRYAFVVFRNFLFFEGGNGCSMTMNFLCIQDKTIVGSCCDISLCFC